MPKGKTLQLVFKQDFTGQAMLLPPSLEKLVAADHPVRMVAAVLDEVDMKPLLRRYKIGGTSSYHPRMLLKAVVFAYIKNNHGFKRNLMRGLPKVTVGTGLLALAHNLRKKATPAKQKAA